MVTKLLAMLDFLQHNQLRAADHRSEIVPTGADDLSDVDHKEQDVPHCRATLRYQRKLRLIQAAESLDDLRVCPANRLEQLHGDREDPDSIRINIGRLGDCHVFRETTELGHHCVVVNAWLPTCSAGNASGRANPVGCVLAFRRIEGRG
jgi:hypothetical protein